MSEQRESPTITPDAPPAPATPVALAGDELTAARELVLRAHPNVVPELVSGATIAELTASVPTAEAAYQRIADALKPAVITGPTPKPTAPSVPAGAATQVVDLAKLPPHELIRRGVEQLKRGTSSQ